MNGLINDRNDPRFEDSSTFSNEVSVALAYIDAYIAASKDGHASDRISNDHAQDRANMYNQYSALYSKLKKQVDS